MSNQLAEDVLSDPAQAWDTVRRVREPLAWILLAVAAAAIVVSAWQLFGLPGSDLPAPATAVSTSNPVPVGTPVPVTGAGAAATGVGAATGAVAATGAGAATGAVAATPFGWRASAVAPQFVSGGIFTVSVLSVILVAFAGDRTHRARRVVQTAVSIQAVALGLGVLSWLGALSAHLRSPAWFVFDAIDMAAVAAALIFSVAVMRSQALRPLTDFGDDDNPGDDEAEVDEDV